MNQIKAIITLILTFMLLANISLAATLEGSIYDSNLEITSDVLVQINNNQKFLSKDGTFTFELEPGTYNIKATKAITSTTEQITFNNNNQKVIFDIFLLGDFQDEDEIWQDANENLVTVEEDTFNWKLYVAIALFIVLFVRLLKARKKYGPLKVFRKKQKSEQKKSIDEHKQDLEKEPELTQKALEIIKKHDGRINQKQLRKEMNYLSEAKVSLIVTQLEHEQKLEKIKKGRGNVLILKDNSKK